MNYSRFLHEIKFEDCSTKWYISSENFITRLLAISWKINLDISCRKLLFTMPWRNQILPQFLTTRSNYGKLFGNIFESSKSSQHPNANWIAMPSKLHSIEKILLQSRNPECELYNNINSCEIVLDWNQISSSQFLTGRSNSSSNIFQGDKLRIFLLETKNFHEFPSTSSQNLQNYSQYSGIRLEEAHRTVS